MGTVLSSDHSETRRRTGTRMGKTGRLLYLLFLKVVNNDSEQPRGLLLILALLTQIYKPAQMKGKKKKVAIIILLRHEELKLWQLRPALPRAEKERNGND